MSGRLVLDGSADRRSDGWVLLVVAAVVLLVFSAGAAAQTVFVFRPERMPLDELLGAAPDLGVRLFVNVATSLLALVAAAIFRLHERGAFARILIVTAVAGLISLLRLGMQLTLDVYDEFSLNLLLTEFISALLVIAIALGLGLAQMDARRRLRQQERANAQQRLTAASALERLSSEELRVRREVAESLHGTVQNRLVLAEARLDSVLARAEGAIADELSSIRADLDDIRERDVREMSQLLFPAGVNLGVAHAARLLVQRIPPTIAVALDIDERIAASDAIDVERRVLLVRAAEEAITNALKHGGASRLSISLSSCEGDGARLVVVDDGVGLRGDTPALSGLARLRERFEAVGGSLALEGGTGLGARLTAAIPGAAGTLVG